MATKEGRRIATKLLLLLLAAVVVAAPFAEAQGGFTSPPAYGGGGGGFSVTTALLFVAIIVGFFFLGFFSFYIRRWVDQRTAAPTAAPEADAEAEASGGGGGEGRGGGGRPRRRGLDPAAVETLPTMSYAAARAMMKAWGAGEGTLECAVCLAEFDDEGEALRLLPGCCHVFHRDCIDPWLDSHVTCPVCRADLSDPAVLAAAAAAASPPDPAEVDVEMGNHRSPIAARSEHQRSRSVAEDRFTLRLPEHVRREIAHRRAASLSGRGGGGARRGVSVGVGGGGFGTALLRTLSGMRHKKESEVGVILNFIGAPTGETSGAGGGGGGCVSEIRDPRSANTSFKRYARSITFAGFVLQGDVAARDWRPEVFQVSGSLRSATPLAE